MRTNNNDINAAYISAFHDVKDSLSGHDVPWLNSLRHNALARFEATGLPSRRAEDWRYINLKALTDMALKPAPHHGGVASQGIVGLKSLRISIVNGQVDLPQDLPEGLRIQHLKNADKALVTSLLNGPKDDPLADLGAAMMQDAIIIQLDDEVEMRAPLQLVFHSTGANPAQHLGVVIALGKNSRMCVVDHHEGEGRYWSNVLMRFSLDEGARMCHFRLMDDSTDATHSAHRHLHMAKDAKYQQTALYLGGETCRDTLHVDIDGERSHVELKGAVLGQNNQSMDILTRLNHAHADATSEQTYKAVLKDKATSAYQGRVTVKEGAIHTEANQSSASLLLNEGCEANAKPELMIFADDVKCAHGATVGELDMQAYFYLVSRGISPAEARAMLIEAFIGDIIDTIDILEIRTHFLARTHQWMARAFGGTQ